MTGSEYCWVNSEIFVKYIKVDEFFGFKSMFIVECLNQLFFLVIYV